MTTKLLDPAKRAPCPRWGDAIAATAAILALLAVSPATALAQSSDDSDPAATTPATLPASEPVEPAPVSYSPARPLSRFQRSGWFLGASLGVGSISYSANNIEDESGNGGYFFDVRFGGMLSSRFALAVEFWSDGHREDSGQFDEARTQNTLGITGTFWAAPRLWIKAGLGASTLTFHQIDDDIALDGNAYQAAVGYEFMHMGKLAFDGALRITSSSFDDFGGSFRRSALSISVGASRF